MNDELQMSSPGRVESDKSQNTPGQISKQGNECKDTLNLSAVKFNSLQGEIPDGHPHTSDQFYNLGNTYLNQFRRKGEPADLERSIGHHSRAVALTPDGHPDMPRRLQSLGVAFGDRFQRLGEAADLERSIDHYSRALALTPDGHPDMPLRLHSLGVAFHDRFLRLGEAADLERSIDHYSRALVLTPDGHPDMPRQLQNLGVAFRDRFQRLGEAADLERSIDHHSRALVLTPQGHPYSLWNHFNLAVSYLHQYLRTEDCSYSNMSLQSFRSATQILTAAPRDRFDFALRWATLASSHTFLNPLEAYQTTVELLPQFIWLGATTAQRYRDLSTAESLAANAANAAIRSSNYTLALEWLEHARCVVWTQTLMLRSPLDQLHSSRPDLATRLQTVTSELDRVSTETQTTQALSSGSITPEQAGQQRRRLAQEYQSLLAEVRQLTGFEDFLQPMKASGLIRAARNGPIVVINCHKACCDALLILPGSNNVEYLSLPNFDNEKAQQARSKIASSLWRKGIRERGAKLLYDQKHKDHIGSVLGTLWHSIVQPVLDHLGYMNNDSNDCLPHITWCPTGALSFLPFHAAGDYSQPQSRSRVFDYVISSYTPTLTALLSSSLSSINQSPRVLGIAQANTPDRNQLPGTLIELTNIQARTQGKAEYTQLVGDKATAAAVLDAMEQHDWVHLACHAHQNLSDPTKSEFYLHNSTLDLATIRQRYFKNKGLAFLSACQTATGDDELPDEAVHLASGMLMAGYPSVIATMWSVSDSDAPLVADKVYAELMKEGRIGDGRAGKALHHAIAALRDKVGVEEFGRWVPYIHIGS